MYDIYSACTLINLYLFILVVASAECTIYIFFAVGVKESQVLHKRRGGSGALRGFGLHPRVCVILTYVLELYFDLGW